MSKTDPELFSEEEKADFAEEVNEYVVSFQEKNTDITLRQFCLRDRGWIPFEATEAGYLEPLITTMLEIEKKEQKLDTNFIRSLHKKATHKVENLVYETLTDADKSQPGNFRTEKSGTYPLSTLNTNPEGINELLDKMLSNTKNFPEHDLSIDTSGFSITSKNVRYEDRSALIKQISDSMAEKKCYLVSNIHRKTSEKIKDMTEKMLNDYKKSIKQAKTPEAKIRCIVTLIRDLEQLHPFADANCRTLCMLLLNKLLMENGFPPAMLKNPNHFDGYSIDSLVSEVIQGMENTLDMATKRKDRLFDVSTDEILSLATPKEAKYAESLGIIESSKVPVKEAKAPAKAMEKSKAEAKPSKFSQFISSFRSKQKTEPAASTPTETQEPASRSPGKK